MLTVLRQKGPVQQRIFSSELGLFGAARQLTFLSRSRLVWWIQISLVMQYSRIEVEYKFKIIVTVLYPSVNR